MEQYRGDAAVLSSGKADGDSLTASQVDLLAELVSDPTLEERDEVVAAEMLPAVPNQGGGGGVALRAPHCFPPSPSGIIGLAGN